MTDLDPTMLAKFEQFQAMLAETPEIVEALNSPELLALAALAAEKKNANATPEAEADTEPEPEPNYPMVGYGHSDDVSVMSEMSIPTVVTKQTVEEDEFYPEIDATGVSTSGLGATRRIGMRIGANAGSFETTNGTLPPPPPKHNNLSSLSNSNSNSNSNSSRRTSSSRRGRGNILNKPKIRMSKISEHDGSASASVTSESTEPELRKRRPPLTAKKGNWKPNRSAFGSTTTTTAARDDEPFPVELEKHPFNNNKGSTTTTTTTSSSSTTVPTKNKSDANGRGGLRKRNSTHGRKGPDSADDAGANPNRRGEGVATDGFAVTVGERQSLSPVPTRQLSESKLSLTRIPRRSNELLRKTSLSNGSIGSASASGGSGSSSRDGRPRSAPKMRLVPVTKTPTPKTTTTLTRSGSDQGRSHTRSHSRGRGGKTNTTRPRSRSRVRTRAPARDQEQEHEQKHEQKHEISNPIVAAALQKNFHNDDSADTDNQNQNNSHSHKHEPKLSDSNRRSPKRWTRPSNDDPSSVPSAFRAPSRRQLGTGGHSQKSRDSTHGTKSSRGSTSTATSLFSTKSKSKRILGNSNGNGNGNSNSSKVASEEQRMVSITASPSQSQVQVQSQSQSDSSDPVTSQSDTKSRTYSSSNPRKSLVAPNRKSSSNRTRSEEPTKSVSPTTTPGSDDDEDDYVPRKVRKPARSKSSSSTDKQTTKTSRSSNGNDNSNGNSSSNRNRSSSSDDEIYVPDPEIFKKMIYGDLSHQNHASRPDEFVHSAGTGTSTNTNTSTSTSTRIKKERPKPTYGNNKVNSNRADEWLGSGTTQKRTWRVKGSSN